METDYAKKQQADEILSACQSLKSRIESARKEGLSVHVQINTELLDTDSTTGLLVQVWERVEYVDEGTMDDEPTRNRLHLAIQRMRENIEKHRELISDLESDVLVMSEEIKRIERTATKQFTQNKPRGPRRPKIPPS